GISAIARVLLERGYRVSGSDLHLSPVAEALAASGATVMIGHQAENIGDAETLLVSSAVPEDNVEVVAARKRGIPVLKRDEFLSQLMAGTMGIAIAGTAGKTTTAGMLAWILVQGGLDPSFIVGGVIEGLGTNAQSGHGPHFVIEADEYDRMFLGLAPTVAAVTHLEHDHPDCYPTFAEMREAFARFIEPVPGNGLIVGCADHPAVRELLSLVWEAAVQTCGLSSANDWYATEVLPNPLGGHDLNVWHRGQRWHSIRLRVPGLYNVRNALVAVAIADWLGMERGTVCSALRTFTGIGRRFQVLGKVGEMVVVDDYAHHPTKIRAALSAARAHFPERPVWAVFQPHTYSRTRALWGEFVECLGQADHVIVLDVYPARETDTLGVDPAALAAQITRADARYVRDLHAAVAYLRSHVEPNAVVLSLSAGDGNQVAVRLLEQLAELQRE
ncbi:MAG: UDP-N-acetylmuramate--L-alanine ligase, partial [Anaerolineae bacterium]